MNQNLNDAKILLDIRQLLVYLSLLSYSEMSWIREVLEVYQDLKYRSKENIY